MVKMIKITKQEIVVFVVNESLFYLMNLINKIAHKNQKEPFSRMRMTALLSVVARTGFEPVSAALRGR